MNKNTKMILGVGAVAIVGYLVYKQMNKKAEFANAVGIMPTTTSRTRSGFSAPGCPCGARAADQSAAPAGWEVCAGTDPKTGLNDKMCRKVGTATETKTFVHGF